MEGTEGGGRTRWLVIIVDTQNLISIFFSMASNAMYLGWWLQSKSDVTRVVVTAEWAQSESFTVAVVTVLKS